MAGAALVAAAALGLLADWSATVNGEPAKIYQANATGRAVALDPGTHRIEMIYRAPGLRTGAWISAVACLLWGAGILMVFLYNRKRTTIPPQKPVPPL